MSHFSTRPLSDDEYDLVAALANLSISGTNQGIAKTGATSLSNITFGSGTGGVSSVNGLTGAVALTGTANQITISAANVFALAPTITGLTSVTSTTFVGALTGNASTATALATGRTISISGDLTYTSPSFDGSGNVTAAGTLATVNSNVGTFGSATQSTQITVNGKGLITAIANVTVTPAVGSITGLGTGVATWLATPSSANLLSALTDKTGTGVNVFGTAPTFTTSITLSTANIITDTTTGTKFGTATNQKIGFYNSTPIVQPTGDVITGLQNLGLMASATITATTNANLTGPITSVGNATSIASQTGTGTKFVVDTSPLIQTTLEVRTATDDNLFVRGKFSLSTGVVFQAINNTKDADRGFEIRASTFLVAASSGVQIGSGVNSKFAGTAVRATTEGTNHIDIFDGTAPVGTLANGISLYSTSGELRVMDSAGNATLLSPHEKGTNYWIYDSKDSVSGKRLKIDVEQLLRKLNDKFGWNFVHDLLE